MECTNPITVPVGIIILRHINKISEVKEIIEYENVYYKLVLLTNRSQDLCNPI
jgi:hypothetical protein